jgi:uncharacterized protein
MSRENVEIVRRGYDAYERGDIPSWLELFDPEVVFHQNADFPDSPPLRGREGLLEWVEDVNEVWEGAHFEPHTFRASGDFVVVSGRGTGRARGSGIPMDLPAHQVFRLRNGRVSEMWGYSDEAQALEVAGLRE